MSLAEMADSDGEDQEIDLAQRKRSIARSFFNISVQCQEMAKKVFAANLSDDIDGGDIEEGGAKVTKGKRSVIEVAQKMAKKKVSKVGKAAKPLSKDDYLAVSLPCVIPHMHSTVIYGYTAGVDRQNADSEEVIKLTTIKLICILSFYFYKH